MTLDKIFSLRCRNLRASSKHPESLLDVAHHTLVNRIPSWGITLYVPLERVFRLASLHAGEPNLLNLSVRLLISNRKLLFSGISTLILYGKKLVILVNNSTMSYRF